MLSDLDLLYLIWKFQVLRQSHGLVATVPKNRGTPTGARVCGFCCVHVLRRALQAASCRTLHGRGFRERLGEAYARHMPPSTGRTGSGAKRRRAADTEPRAARIEYPLERALSMKLTNGTTVTSPVRLIPTLRLAVYRDIRAIEVLGRGGGLRTGKPRSRSERSQSPFLHVCRTGVAGRARPCRWPKIFRGHGGRSAPKRAQRRPPQSAVYRLSNAPGELYQ